MSMNKRHVIGATAVATLGLLLGTAAFARPAASGVIKLEGDTSLSYKGPVVDVALGYRFARADLGSKWLLLSVEMTATGSTVAVPRSAIAVRTPSGEVVPLASQKAFAAAYGELRSTIAAADIASEPLDYLIPQPPQRLAYFANPGYHLAFSTVWLNANRDYYGRLFFHVPEGTRRGVYTLLIDLPRHTVRIPFTL